MDEHNEASMSEPVRARMAMILNIRRSLLRDLLLQRRTAISEELKIEHERHRLTVQEIERLSLQFQGTRCASIKAFSFSAQLNNHSSPRLG